MDDELRRWLLDHERRLTKLEAYIKLVAAETTLLLPLVISVILWLLK